MAGLVPAIHSFFFDCSKQDVDARHKAGMTAERLELVARIERSEIRK